MLVRCVRFDRWRGSLGWTEGSRAGADLIEARSLAAQVERAGHLLPFRAKCLPRAMALSWMLRRRRIGHSLIIAVRPFDFREAPDALHAWVEVAGMTVIGELPGRWIETLRLGL